MAGRSVWGARHFPACHVNERALFPLLVLSTLGLVLSIAAHAMASAGLPLPGGGLVWLLHIGIFAVWLPVVILSKSLNRSADGKDFWKAALAGCPKWMRYGISILFAYVVFNFVFFIATVPNRPKKPAGDAPPSVVRGFSGHWMIFYGAAVAIFYSRIHSPHLFRVRKCPNGHEAAPTERICAVCGQEIPDNLQSA